MTKFNKKIMNAIVRLYLFVDGTRFLIRNYVTSLARGMNKTAPKCPASGIKKSCLTLDIRLALI